MDRHTWVSDYLKRLRVGIAAAFVVAALAALLVPATAFAGAESEPNSSIATANAYTGGSMSGTISPSGDSDYFSFSFVAGNTYYIWTYGGTLPDPELALYTAAGGYIDGDDNSGPGVQAAFSYSPGSTATRYIRVTGHSGTGTYGVMIGRFSPTAASESYSATEDTLLSVPAAGVLSNDSDADGNPIVATGNGNPSHGTLNLNSDGSFTYMPDSNWNGTDHFHYRAYDGYGYSSDVQVNINVAAVNDAPVAVGNSYTVAEDTTIVRSAPGVLSNDSDIDGGPLTAWLVSDVSNGNLVLNSNGSFTYQGDLNYNGPDSFTYYAYDGNLPSNVVTVNLTVTPVNDVPVCVPDTGEVTEDMSVFVSAPGVLGNDLPDVEGSLVTAWLYSGPSNGAATVYPDGSYTYVPDPDFFGTDTFEYRGFDGTGYSAPCTVTMTVYGTPDAPVSVADTYTTPEDTALVVPAIGVLSNDVNVDLDELTAMLISGVEHGELSFNEDGSFSYTPDENWFGTDSFEYNPYNTSALHGVTVVVTIEVTSVNDLPVAEADSYGTDEDNALIVDAPGVLANDSDPVEGSPLTAVLVDDVSNGTLDLHADGSFMYTPDADFNGSDSFTYHASDGDDYSNTVTVDITVNAVNDAPSATDDFYQNTEDFELDAAAPGVLGNDVNVDGDTVTVEVVTGPSHGELTLYPDGGFVYMPDPNYNGDDTFQYRSFDGEFYSEPATVTINMAAVYDPPVAVEDTYTTDEDQTLFIGAPGMLENDLGDGPLTVSAWHDSDYGTAGTVTAWPDGRMRYVPPANFNGTDTFVYRITDGLNRSAYVTVTINVVSVNDLPVAEGESYSTAEDTLLTVDAPGVLGNDSDPVEGSPLTAELVDDVSHGTLALNGDGSFTYMPDADYNGPDGFTYKAWDGEDYSDTVAVDLNVTAVQDAPVGVADSYSVEVNSVLTIPDPGVLGNDTDADGDTLTAPSVDAPSHGQLDFAGGGGFTYTPDEDYVGSDSFTYRAYDGIDYSELVTVSIDVTPIPTFTLNFETDETPGATLTGTTTQVVVRDTDASAVTANNPTGYHFVRWTGTGGFETTTANPLTVTGVTTDMTITAEYAINNYALTYNAGAHGSVSGTTPQHVNHGANGSTVTAVPATHYHFVAWSDGVLTAARRDMGVTHGVTVTASFEVDRVPVWRFYNLKTDTHFYTASISERDRVIATLAPNMRFEGMAYEISADGEATGDPLYRFYNLKTGAHFYTAFASERDRVLTTLSATYRFEGIAYWVSDDWSPQPVYRFTNLKTGGHFYTASTVEKNRVLATFPTYRYEGIVFYVMAEPD